jgi:hypothetical protein
MFGSFGKSSNLCLSMTVADSVKTSTQAKCSSVPLEHVSGFTSDLRPSYCDVCEHHVAISAATTLYGPWVSVSAAWSLTMMADSFKASTYISADGMVFFKQVASVLSNRVIHDFTHVSEILNLHRPAFSRISWKPAKRR